MSNLTEIEEVNEALLLSVWGDRFTQRATKGDKYARLRTYINKEDVEVEIYEIVHKKVVGKIIKMFTRTQESGHQQLILRIMNKEELALVFIPVRSKYFTTFVSRMPGIDYSKEVTLYAYDFTPESSTRKIGIGVMQDGSKLSSYYWDNVKKCRVGLPESKIPYDEMSEEQRKEYFANQTQFFMESVELINSHIPKDELYERADKKASHAGDDFLSQAPTANKPKL